MRAGGVAAALGAAIVMLMAPGMASAQAGLDAADEIQSQLQDASMAAEDHMDDAEAQKDETEAAADPVLDAYGTAVEWWPGLAFMLDHGQTNVLPHRRQEKAPAPPPEDEVRGQVEMFLGNRTNGTAPEPNVTSKTDTPRANETIVNATTAPEPIATPQAERSPKPERAARSPQDPPGPMAPQAAETHPLPTAEIAALAAASVALGLIAWLASQTRFIGRFLAGVPGAALFSRQTGPEVLRSPVRARIHAAVTNESGITFAKLRQLMGMPPSTLRYHVAVLRRENLIRVTRRGGILHYHEVGARVDGEAKAREHLFWRDRGLLASTILQHPGANQTAVARMTGLLPSRVSEYTKELADAGLVRSERVGRCRQYFATPMLQAMMDSGQVPTSGG